MKVALSAGVPILLCVGRADSEVVVREGYSWIETPKAEFSFSSDLNSFFVIHPCPSGAMGGVVTLM